MAVSSDQAPRGEAHCDLRRVPAQAERSVQIDPVRPDIQIFNTFVQQHGYMTRLCHQKSSSSITAAMFSGFVSSANTVLQASLFQSSAWLLQPTTVTFLSSPA